MSETDAASMPKPAKKRLDIAIMFAICGALFSLLIFLFMLKQERDAAIQAFQVEMTQKVAELDRQLQLNLQSLESLQAFYLMSDQIEADDFKQIAQRVSQRNPNLQAMIWRSDDGQQQLWVPLAEARDLSSDAQIQALLTSSKSLVVSAAGQAPSIAATGLAENQSFLLASPVRSGGELLAVISLQELIKHSQLGDALSGISVQLSQQAGEETTTLYNAEITPVASDAVFVKQLPLNAAQSWSISLAASEEYLSQRTSFLPAMFLLTGLLLSFLLASYLKRVTGHLKNLEQEQEEMSQQLQETAWSDPLTGIANRGHFDEALDIECRRAVRDFSPLTLILIEVDDFIEYSAHYGEAKSDQSLMLVAEALRECVARPGDMVARIEDHVFGFILPSTNELVSQLADRCCEHVRKLEISHETAVASDVMTVSIGVATLQPSRFLTPERLLEITQEQLGKAQQAGGDQFSAHAEKGLEPSVTYSV